MGDFLLKCTLFLALCCASYAAIFEPISANRDRAILLSLDVDESFLADEAFQAMKTNFAFYRQETFLRVLSDAYIYQPLIKEKIAEAGLPPALVYMAMAESSFKPSAYSRARASGLWQFIRGTGKRYGLRVDDYVDERRDPIRATDAAIAYLKDLHAEFGKWSLAIMAYNCGEGRVRSAIKEAGTDDLAVLMSVDEDRKKQLLPRETRDYLRRVLALAILAESESLMVENDSEHLLNRGSSYPMAIVEVAPGAMLYDVARAAGVSTATLKQMNPALRYEFTPPYGEKYFMNIPYDRVLAFKQNYVFAPSQQTVVAYIVQKGDNLGAIAMRYGSTPGALRDFNSIQGNRIKPGQRLVIPLMKGSGDRADRDYFRETSASPRAAKKRRVARDGEYVVQRGDSLDSIARRFKVSITDLKNRNQIKANRIYAGDRLIINR
ncbi:MAG: LysM peptidoglycan-binding domain-containing protein [Helicobacteraceae bacterium]|nr:LysM peptidoglycan-binding domain-containing protein [Helicobacteraceae bacterium]